MKANKYKLYDKAYAKSEKGKRSQKRRMLKWRYGVTEEVWNDMLRLQGGKCGLWAIGECGGRLGVDHNHITKQVRGILCRKHNTQLGVYESLRHALLNLERYLKCL